MTKLNGWIIIDKPLGMGSTQVVSAVKRALRTSGYPRVKVGHGGTLDPLATGVLPIALGEATKLCGQMLDASKVYDFTIAFGTQTDSLDREGAAIATSDARPVQANVTAVLPRFTGLIEQVPPSFSALKIDGKRAYDLARLGEAVEMKSRTVTVHALSCVDFDGDSATLSAHVSKGTYIRSLARDIALALGTVGHVAMLRRTRAGPFSINQAISLDKLAGCAKRRALEELCLPLEAGLDGIPALILAPDEANVIRHGGTLFGQSVNDGTYLAKDGHKPVALVSIHAGVLAVERGFNL
ncbi:MAG: tRNA pseudouridine(55) synthase TruB [Sphingopyxis sp.]